MFRVVQNSVHTLYLPIYLVNSLPKKRIHTVNIRFWPTLYMLFNSSSSDKSALLKQEPIQDYLLAELQLHCELQLATPAICLSLYRTNKLRTQSKLDAWAVGSIAC